MSEDQEQRFVYFDRDLKIEAYRLSGIVQKFPNHFHDCYVIGCIESGRRHLWCKNREYDLEPGDLILFNPRDNHYCSPINGEALDYRAVNISPEVLAQAVKESTGSAYEPLFSQNVIRKSDCSRSLIEVYEAIMRGAPRLEKEEAFFFLLEQVLQENTPLDSPSVSPTPDPCIKKLCAYMEEHFAENISLDTLLAMTTFGKSYLLRLFTRQAGVSPYRYLQTVRLDRAKKFLERGITPADAAAMTGFADQSHFTNYFKEFTGLTPGQYQRIFTSENRSAAETKK